MSSNCRPSPAHALRSCHCTHAQRAASSSSACGPGGGSRYALSLVWGERKALSESRSIFKTPPPSGCEHTNYPLNLEPAPQGACPAPFSAPIANPAPSANPRPSATPSRSNASSSQRQAEATGAHRSHAREDDERSHDSCTRD